MFRQARILRTVPSVGAFEAHKRVNRFLGGRYEKFSPIATYSQLISGEGNSDVVVTAARLGRAQGYISRGAYKAALEDVNAVIKNPSPTAPELTALAAAMRFNINNALLDLAEEAMLGSDGGNASQVSDLRGAVSNDLEYLVSKRQGCQLTALAKAEFMMAQGKYQDAAQMLDGVIERFSLPAPGAGPQDKVTVDASNAADVIAYQLQSGTAPSADAVAAYKAKLNVTSNDVAVAIAPIFAAAAADHVFIDFFSPTDRYALWKSEAAEAVRQNLGHQGGVSPAIDNALNHYSATKPKDTVDIAAALKDNKPILKSLSSLPKSTDAEFNKLLEDITASAKKYQTSEPKTVEQWAAFSADLREQFVARSKTNKAVCLTELKKEAEALALLDEVIAGDKYLHMWKAFLARGRANKASGHVDAAEADLKKLFALKLTHHNLDVPLKDEYRTKSVF